MKEFDVRDLACPGPVLKLRQLLEAGEREIRFHVADDLCRSNVTRFAASRGATVEVEDGDDGTFFISIAASDTARSPAQDDADLLVCDLPEESRAGSGARRPQRRPGHRQHHGRRRRRAGRPAAALVPEDPGPARARARRRHLLQHRRHAVLRGIALVDDLLSLEQSGVEIIACGTCLNFFGLADRLAVGRVTDMLEIASRLAAAGSIVRP